MLATDDVAELYRKKKTMSNVNTSLMLENLPVQTVSTASAVLTVPAAVGTYPGYPSPSFSASGAWFIPITDLVAQNAEFDGHPFKVRMTGLVTIGTSNSTFTPQIYLGPSPGTAPAALPVTTVGSNTSIGIGTATGSLTAATTYNWWQESTLFWDSTTKKLTGFYLQFANSVLENSGTPTAITPTTVVIGGLQFLPVFAFGTTQSNNTVQLTEFCIDRA